MTCCRLKSYRGNRLTGFTLVELMVILLLLGILATLVMPVFRTSTDGASTEVLATNVRNIRGLIIHHSGGGGGGGGGALSPTGFPVNVDPLWFKLGRLPDH